VALRHAVRIAQWRQDTANDVFYCQIWQSTEDP
jgi:hypothetical protein